MSIIQPTIVSTMQPFKGWVKQIAKRHSDLLELRWIYIRKRQLFERIGLIENILSTDRSRNLKKFKFSLKIVINLNQMKQIQGQIKSLIDQSKEDSIGLDKTTNSLNTTRKTTNNELSNLLEFK